MDSKHVILMGKKLWIEPKVEQISSPPQYRESSIPPHLVNVEQAHPKWLCKKCNKIFIDLLEITTHLKLHFDGHFNCLFCKYTLTIDHFVTRNRVVPDTNPIWSGSSDIQCIVCKQFHNGNNINVFNHMCTHLFDTFNLCMTCLHKSQKTTTKSSVELLNIGIMKNSNIHTLASELGIFETPNMNKNIISQQTFQAPVYKNNILPFNGFNNNQVICNTTVFSRPPLTKNGYVDPVFLPSNIPRQQHNSLLVHVGADQNLLCQQSSLSSPPRFSPPSHVRSDSGPRSIQLITQTDSSTAKTSVLNSTIKQGLPSMTNNSLENLKRLIKRIYLDPAIGITSPLHMEKTHGVNKIKKQEVNSSSVAKEVIPSLKNDNLKASSNCEPWFVIQSCSGNFNQFNDIPESLNSILSDNLNLTGNSTPTNYIYNKIDPAKQLLPNEKNISPAKNLSVHQTKQINLNNDNHQLSDIQMKSNIKNCPTAFPHLTRQLNNIHSNPSHITTQSQLNASVDKSSNLLLQNIYLGLNNPIAKLTSFPNRNISDFNQPKQFHVENSPSLCNKAQNTSFNQCNTYPTVGTQVQINNSNNSLSTGAKFDTYKNNSSSIDRNPLSLTLQCSVPTCNSLPLRSVTDGCTKDQSVTLCGANQIYSNLSNNPYKNVTSLQVTIDLPTAHESEFRKVRQLSLNESLTSVNAASHSKENNRKPSEENLKQSSSIVQNLNQTQLSKSEPTYSEAYFKASKPSDIYAKVSSAATPTRNANKSRENNLTQEIKKNLSNQSSILNVPNIKKVASELHVEDVKKHIIADSLQMYDSNNSAICQPVNSEDIEASHQKQNMRINELGNKSSVEKSGNNEINIGKVSYATKNKLSVENASENILDRDTLISCRCGLCNYAFNTMRDLYSHQIMEHLIVLYTCESCGNQLDLPWFLFLDKNCKFRDCVCKHCNAQFDIPKLDHLSKIMCYLCLKTMDKFNDSHLKDHFDINNECYICLECKQTFERKKNLQDHCSEQHFLTCESCMAKFNRMCTFEKHLTGHENNSRMAYNKNTPVKQKNGDYSEEKSKRRIESGEPTQNKSTKDTKNENFSFIKVNGKNNTLIREEVLKRGLQKECDIPSKKKKSDPVKL